jgi:hypothetical protein
MACRECPNCGFRSPLSIREHELMRALGVAGSDGLAVDAILERLSIRRGTLGRMIWSIRGKLGINAVLTSWDGRFRIGDSLKKAA